MSLFDEFEPKPDILCPTCKDGYLRRWQGKHSKHLLFQWRQGVNHPIAHTVDPEVQKPNSDLLSIRLPTEEDIWISYGECDSCGYCFGHGLFLSFTGDTWTGFKESEREVFANCIEEGWIQCPKCLNAYELDSEQVLCHCEDCSIWLIKR